MEDIKDANILLLEDNKELLAMLVKALKKDGYLNLYPVLTCKEAKEKFYQNNLDLMILDVMLPDGDGFSLLKEIRKYSNVPALFLSAKDEDQDRLTGLGLGADDYITKPFLFQELLLRVQAILKRTYFSKGRPATEPETLSLGDCVIHFLSAAITTASGEYVMTAKELAILKKLYENRGNIVTFDTLCETVWGDGYYGYENTLMVHIRHLREKIEVNPSSPKWLLTVRGLGYKLAK